MSVKHLNSLLESKCFSDCTFIIEDQKIKVHKLFFASVSPFFKEMFYGPKARNEIQISDISLDDFNQLLEFIYTGRITFTSETNAWSLFEIGHRYLMDDFLDVCIHYIKENLTISNLVLSYEYADFFDIKSVKMRWLNDICWYTKGIFSEEYYYHMKPSTLAEMLKNKLNIDKTNLCRGVLYWACNECDNINIKKLPENILRILNDSKLDYLLSLQCESFKEVNLSQETNQLILESYKLLKAKYLKNSKKVTIINQTDVHWSSFCKFREVKKIAFRIPFDSTKFESTLSVNVKIILFGLVVNSNDISNYDNKYVKSLKIKIKGPNRTWKLTYNLPKKQITYYVPVDNLIVLEPGTSYKIHVIFLFNNARFFKSGTFPCYCMSNVIKDEENGIQFTFDESNGGVIKGLCYYPI